MWSCGRARKPRPMTFRSFAARAWRASSGPSRSSFWMRCRRMPSAKSCARSCMRKTRAKPETTRPSAASRRGNKTSGKASGGGRDPGAIEIELSGGALVVTLRRSRAQNRISHAMARELMDLAETVEDDDSILALGITGEGTEFCAGFDERVDPRLVETLALLCK